MLSSELFNRGNRAQDPLIVTVHEPRVTSVQKCIEPRRYLPSASVDPTNGTRISENL